MWGRRTAPQRLVESAGLNWKNVDDQSVFNVAMLAAYVAASREMRDDVLPMVGKVAEKLAADEANYDLVLGLVENLVHLASHGLDDLHTAEEIRAVLGPRCLVVWEAVEKFWMAVAEWCRGTGEPLRSSVDMLSVENVQLRATLLTSNMSLGDDTRVGISDAVRYEDAGGAEIPGYRELIAP